ncbi:amidohydrolase family protein [Wukongibacter baidiensis]|uniref:amidohydrolase family protein n=1 Tax=Wukongibacter baidiensis TaxID=1723361 RepID=UPI003D7F80CF
MLPTNLKIIDSHAHFLVKGMGIGCYRDEYIDRFGEEKWNRLQSMNEFQRDQWRRAWGFPDVQPPKESIEETALQWKEDLEKKNIEKIIFATAGNYEKSNANMEKIVKMYPEKFIGYAYHDPFSSDAPELLEKAIIEQGLKGFKILAPDLNGRIDDPKLDRLWKVAEKYRIPVLIHFGILGGAGGIAYHPNISPIILHDVAKAYPDVPFIIPHFGCGQVKDALQLAWACPNIYIDTTGSNQWVRWMPYDLTVKDLFKKYYETIGPHRIIFGTDGSWFPRGFVYRYAEDQYRDCVYLGFTESEINMIFNENIIRILENIKV